MNLLKYYSRLIFFVVLIPIILLYSNCSPAKPSIEKIELTVIMGGKCAFQYKLDNKGKGTLTIGTSSSYKDTMFSFSTVKQTLAINLEGKGDVEKYQELTKKINLADKIEGSHNWDAWRCMLKINEIKKIDVYGTQESKDLLALIELISSSRGGDLDEKKCY